MAAARCSFARLGAARLLRGGPVAAAAAPPVTTALAGRFAAGSASVLAWSAPTRGLELSAAMPQAPALFASFASRGVASAAEKPPKSGDKKKTAEDYLMEQEEAFDTLTDKIPEKPVGVVEGTSYTVVILAGLALAGATVWAVVKELLLEPKEYTVFNKTLDYIKNDPRVTVRLGGSISGYGADSRNRAARQRIPNRIYTDSNGTEHVQVQFQAKGSSGGATVHADMFMDGAKVWQYTYLYVDVDAPYPQRLVLVNPQYAAAS